MEKKIGKIERKSKFRAGTFFCGIFFGIILCLALIIGLGSFVYFNVSASWLNKTFNVGVDLGNEELNKKTLKDLVSVTVGIAGDLDNYSMERFEKDFGIKIPNEISGIKINDLKSVGLTKLSDAVQEKMQNISVYELEGVIGNEESIKKIFDKTETYYLNDGKLYKEDSFTNEVSFKYSINADSTKVIIKDQEVASISSGSVDIKLKYLPMTTAIDEYTSSLGESLTLGELETDYGVTLPSFFKNVDRSTSINQLETEINNLYLADIMGYTISGDKVYNGSIEITGVVATLSKKQVKDLTDIDNTINALTIAEVMDYTELADGYYKDGTKVSGIMSKIASFKVEELSIKVNELTIADIMDYSVSGTGENKVYTDSTGKTVTGVMKKLAEISVGGLSNIKSTIDSMTIAEILDYQFDQTTRQYYIDDNDNASYDVGEEITGVMKVVADTTVGGLTEKVSSIRLYEVLGYTENAGNYYDGEISETNKVSGIMAVLAGKKLNEISKTIDELTVSQIFTDTSSGVLSLLTGNETIKEIPSAIETAIKTKTLDDLQNAGLTEASDQDLDKTISYGGTVIRVGSLKLEQIIEIVIMSAT